jgi:hypothetical protein
MDSYDLVVLKTVAICEYGVRVIGSTYIWDLLLDAIVLNIDHFPPWWTLSLLQVRAVSARYIMKCDDDNFVRIQSVMAEVKKIPSSKSLYIGNMNYRHTPMRDGKWAVTYEVNNNWFHNVLTCPFLSSDWSWCFITVL